MTKSKQKDETLYYRTFYNHFTYLLVTPTKTPKLVSIEKKVGEQ